MAEQETGKVRHKISNVTAGFMIGIALIFDGIQFLLTLSVIASLFSILVTFFAACVFGVWFAILGINYFSGRKSGLKALSMLSSVIVELVPLVDGLPGITAGVLGIIVSTRIEERSKDPPTPKPPSNRVRFGTQKLPS